MSFQRKVALACVLLLLFDFILYFHTQAPAVQFMDSGELAVVCATLGIAHPTGYPIYTLLGRVFALLPLKDMIFRLNLISFVFACLTNLGLFFIVLKIIKNQSDIKIWVALLTALIFSFTPALWSQATCNEVYSLNIFLYSLIIILILIWTTRFQEVRGSNLFYLLIFIYGLSLGNHMLAVLLLPAISFMVLSYEGRALFRPKRMLLIAFFFLLGISVYLYIPIRSSQNPLLDWGNPEIWSAFKRHVSGWQYKVWMFTQSTEKLIFNFQNFIKLFFHQFPFYFLPFSLFGIYRLFVHCRKILAFFLILFFANIIYGINYDIPDIDPYFLGSFLVNAIFMGNGFFFAFEKLQKIKLHKVISLSIVFCFVLFPLVTLKKNYFEQDRSRNYLAYDLTSNLLRSMRKDGLILSNVWDHYSVWLYLRYVELKRPDLVFLSKVLCFYSWYADYVKQNYPTVYKNSEDQIESYVKEIRKFENGEPHDLHVIRQKYITMLNSFFSRNANKRLIYDDLVGEQDVGKTFVKIPEGLVSSLRDTFEYYPYNFPDYELRGVADKTTYMDKRTQIFLRPYSFMTKRRIKYLQHFGMEKEAQMLSKKYKDILLK